MQASGLNVFPIMGNHEFMLMQTCLNPATLPMWMKNGARQTLDSFGVKFPDEMEEEYLNFFRSLAYYYLLPEYVIVHGGLNFSIDNPFDDRESMVWERNKEVEPEKSGGRKLIVGHTPQTLDQVRKSLKTNKIMLDGGCVYYKVHQDMGYLCALELNTMKLFTQVNIDY
jgi:serine/threonine protein phosphatase 1